VAEPIQDGIFREIDEELRQEHFAKLWKRYGGHVIALAVLLVVAVGGYQAWRNFDRESRMNDAENFAAALRLAGSKDSEAALGALRDLNANAGSAYRMLSGFRAAATLAANGDAAGAALAYEQIAGANGYDAIYRDLAVILGSIQHMNAPGTDRAAVEARLAPLAANDNPWRHSARELLAVLAEGAGDRARARDLLKALSDDPGAPGGIRQRAGELLAALGE